MKLFNMNLRKCIKIFRLLTAFTALPLSFVAQSEDRLVLILQGMLAIIHTNLIITKI